MDAAMNQPTTRLSTFSRLVRNLTMIPRRTASSVARRFDADFQFERLADRDVRRWLSRDRRRQLEDIPGWSSARECRLLAYLATQAPEGGDIVEIGAWKGKTTAWLVEGANQLASPPKVFSIDPHQRDSWRAFSETVHRFDLEHRGLKVRRNFSHDVGKLWRNPIALLWIDGCHEYEAVVLDIKDFAPHVLPGGWVVFDDAAGGVCPGVEKAIAEQMIGRDGFQQVATIRHLQLFRRQS